MRHGKTVNHLGRKSAHRKSLLSNMASSLILHKRITTTLAKARALKRYVEPLLTKAKNDSTHSRRIVFSYLQNKESVKILFDEVADKIATRPGGYTRIIKLGNRLGDNAEMCMMELVDFNLTLLQDEDKNKSKTRRGRRRKSKSSDDQASAKTQSAQKTESVEEQTAEQGNEASAESQE
ncbi:MAG: 50S ribosomal protein L17 [Microscillaceae bacterium]|nr:50S ribosomal protein L17 [Microscillaceae bacterium]